MKQRTVLTEDEHERLVEVGNSFWTQFGQLAATHIALMPPELQDLTTAHLQDLCSIYGTRYDEHLSKLR